MLPERDRCVLHERTIALIGVLVTPNKPPRALVRDADENRLAALALRSTELYGVKGVNLPKGVELVDLKFAEQRQLRSLWQKRRLGAKNSSWVGVILYPTPIVFSVLGRGALGRDVVWREHDVVFSVHLTKSTPEEFVEVVAIVPAMHRVPWPCVTGGPLFGLHQRVDEGTQARLHVHPNAFIPVVDDTMSLVQEEAGQRDRCCTTTEVENRGTSFHTPVCV